MFIGSNTQGESVLADRPNISPNEHKMSFLFGSGVSIPAGMPSVSEITEKIISGTGIMRRTNGNYYFGQPLYAHDGFPDEYIPRVVTFLKRLSVEIEQYYISDPDRMVNYEDLFYVASQIYDSEVGEYENPIVQAFIDKILPDIRKWKLHEISSEAAHYIHDIVWHSLTKEPANLDYLCCVRDACQDAAVSSVDLFTLNHDTVIEQYLDRCNIRYIEGFGIPINGVRYWSPKVFGDSSYNVRLFKLHGSINWFLFESHTSTQRNEPVGIPINGDFWHTNNPDGQLQLPVDGRPKLLAGTFNKMLQYTTGIYADLYFQMYHALRKTEILILCGYGFGDKGINTRLIEWVYSSPKNVIVVIHAEPESLKMRARGAIFKNWDKWLQNHRLVLIQRWIEDTSWQDILDAIQEGQQNQLPLN
jgi:hypothetical protein